MDELNLRRLEKAVERGFDKVRLLEMLRRLEMSETIEVNARDVLERTCKQELRELLLMLV